MLKDGILVLIGGGIGAAVRELLMLAVANLPGGFPMPIFIANMTAALLIGVLSALTITGGVIGSGGKLLLTTGIMGGLSTFSSFVWGTHQMLANVAEQASAIVYLVRAWSPVFCCGIGSRLVAVHALSHGGGRRREES
jgi:CrcB protein